MLPAVPPRVGPSHPAPVFAYRACAWASLMSGTLERGLLLLSVCTTGTIGAAPNATVVGDTTVLPLNGSVPVTLKASTCAVEPVRSVMSPPERWARSRVVGHTPEALLV